MVNKIIWTQKATDHIDSILAYLHYEVSPLTASKLLELTKDKIKGLENNTFEGRPVPHMRTIRFILVGKYHRLYYRRNGNTLFITQFYDTRQHPDSQPYSKK
jgi:plasmid stabilization system protein ParE